MHVYIGVANTNSRLTTDRWAYLLTQIDILLATGGQDDAVLTRETGPCSTPPTAEKQTAVWLVAVDPAEVLDLQAALSRARTAYDDVTITWAETVLREIAPAPTDAPTDQPGPGAAA